MTSPWWDSFEVAFELAVEEPRVVRAFGLSMGSNSFTSPCTPQSYACCSAFHNLWVRNVALALLAEAGAHSANRSERQFIGRLWWISLHLRQLMRQAWLKTLVGRYHELPEAFLSTMDRIYWPRTRPMKNEVPVENEGRRASIFESADYVMWT